MAVASPGTGPPSTDASDLHTTLEEAEQLIRAIRGCEVDAFVVDSPHGKRVYTLSSADEPYRLLIERMGEGALTLSPAGVILYCNGRFARMLGSPLQTVIGADLRPRLAANDAEIPGGTDALLARLLAGSPGTDLKLECALVRADGSQLPVQIAASGLELNAVRSVCMVVTDLTTRHLYEQSRRDEQLRGHLDERSRTQGQLDLQSVILGQVSDAVVAVDAQQRISYLNHAAEQHYGVSSQGALGRRLDEICTRRWLAPADEALADAAFLNRGDWHGELVHVTRDGREIAVESVKATLWGKGGNPIGMLLTFRDITARKVTEEALRESEVRYRRLFETAKDGIVILDTDTAAIIDANPFIGELLGYSHAELMGKQLWQIGLFKDIEASKDAMRELQERRYIRYEDLPLETKAGRRINVEFVSNVYITGRRSVIQCNIRDITERKTAENALRTVNATLEQRVAERTAEARWRTKQLQALAVEMTQAENRERRRLAQILHDHLQQLLAAAKLRLGSLDVSAGKDTADVERIVSILDESIEAARSLAVELSPPVLYSAGLVAALHWLARWMREKHGLEVLVEADAAADVGDIDLEAFLFHAVRELLFNAVKHSGVKTAHIRLRLAAGGMVELEIEDRGKGFIPETADVGAPNRSVEGFGLLSIRERLDLLGGRIAIDSQPGRGTSISLFLPIRKPPKRLPRSKRGPVAGKVPANARIRVLIADDHQLIREGLVGLLSEQADMVVVGEAPDGQAALEMARKLSPDVVLMDVNMPRMNGIQATRAIIGEFPGLRVIGLSMHTDPEIEAELRGAGAVGYLTKGSAGKTLVKAIHEVCKKKRPSGETNRASLGLAR